MYFCNMELCCVQIGMKFRFKANISDDVMISELNLFVCNLDKNLWGDSGAYKYYSFNFLILKLNKLFFMKVQNYQFKSLFVFDHTF